MMSILLNDEQESLKLIKEALRLGVFSGEYEKDVKFLLIVIAKLELRIENLEKLIGGQE